MRQVLFLSFSLVLFLSSCEGVDDIGGCATANWEGFYLGTIDCGEEESEDVRVMISARGSNKISIFYETDNTTTEYSPITTNDCAFFFDRSEFGISTTLEGELTGDVVFIRNSFSALGIISNCEIIAVRD